jgi:hypothetical protein
MGTLYAVVIGLLIGPLRGSIIAWPILTLIFVVAFWKFRLLRYAGFIAVLPVSVLAFELVWSNYHPGMIADKYLALDRSHYVPGYRAKFDEGSGIEPGAFGRGVKETFIGPDGFRADPETGRGNPERCQLVVIGDSMIYGSGLPYQQTLGPVKPNGS